jgi:replicative DNA helicase
MNQLQALPHSLSAEQAVIAAVINNNKLAYELDHVKESDFYTGAHVIIWRRIQALAFQSIPIDPVVLVNALENANELDSVGGAEYIVDLMTNGTGDSNVQHYAQIIRDRAISRELVRIGHEVSAIGYETGEAQAKIDKVQSLTMTLEANDSTDPVHINVILKKTIEGIDQRFRNSGEIVGLSTGFVDFDKMTCGLGDSDMIVIAGRPSMGKTTLALNIADNVALAGKFVIFYSLEMPSESLNLRSISSIGGVHHERLRSGKIQDEDWPGITAAAARLKDKPMYINDDGSVTSAQILSRSRKIANKAGRKVDLIVIDYLQLLADEGDGTERITKISRRLKLVATALKCPVIVLSQLNRGVENRPLNNRRPMMSDLRESGAIEQDADVIVMTYRDEVYNPNTDQPGIAEAIIAKQRNGPLGTVYLKSELHYSRFRNNQGYIPPQHNYQERSYTKQSRGFNG